MTMMQDLHQVHKPWSDQKIWLAQSLLKVRLTIGLALVIEKSRRSCIHGFIATLQRLVCFVVYAKSFHATARGGWTSRGITDWNQILKNHNDSNWHRDGAIAARMSEQAQLFLTSI